MERYRPSVIVLQGGADSMSGDKLGRLNLSDKGRSSSACMKVSMADVTKRSC